MNKEYWSKLAFASILGLLLSYTFVFLAALPIRYLRLTFGRKAFLLSSTIGFIGLAAFGLLQWALVYLSLCLLIGFYRELEERKLSIFLASAIAIIITAATNLFAFFGYSQIKGINFYSLLTEKSEPLIAQLQQLPRFQEASLDNFLWYIPSAVVITLMMILFVSLTVSKGPGRIKQSVELRMFSLPEWAIWVFIGSLGATFIPITGQLISLISMNVLAITLAGYFFQGLAVFTYFLDRLSIFGFWRLLAFFLAFFQMFIFISGLGILDYWFDFRLQPTNKNTLKTFN